MNTLKFAGILASALSLGLVSASAQTIYTWNGSNGDYATAANWSPPPTWSPNAGTIQPMPDTGSGDTALITSGNVTYDSSTDGGDFLLHNGGTLEISGGSWTQTGGINWIQPGTGGTILVNGGTFNMGTSANINSDATSSFIVTAGTANLSGNFIYNPSTLGAFSLSGTGVVNVGGEFDPNSVFTMSGGTLNITNGIAFSNSATSGVSLSGGTITVNGTWQSYGFYAASQTNGVNFTAGSTGTLFISGVTAATVTGTSNLLTSGAITYNGTIDASEFIVTNGTDGGTSGVYITTASAIPEPSTCAALLGLAALGLVVLRRRRNG